MTISLLSYLYSWNLGDAIQTIAMRNLLEDFVDDPDITYRERGTANGAALGEIHICNGYLDERWTPAEAGATILAGVHMANRRPIQNLHTMKDAINLKLPVGARDPYTAKELQQFGIDSEFIGCATLTLPPYHGERWGVYSVDMIDPPCAMDQEFTHYIPSNISWIRQIALANSRLSVYRRATCVFTTRIHVALPCIAFGTPVYLQRIGDQRLTLLDHLGVKYDEIWNSMTSQTVKDLASKFRKFVFDRLNECRV